MLTSILSFVNKRLAISVFLFWIAKYNAVLLINYWKISFKWLKKNIINKNKFKINGILAFIFLFVNKSLIISIFPFSTAKYNDDLSNYKI